MNHQFTRSVSRAFAILRCFTPEQPELSLSAISRITALNKTTVHRLLETLCAERVLERRVTGEYAVGPSLYATANLYLETNDVLRAAAPVARTVNHLCGECVSIGCLERQYVTLILREETTYGFRWARHVGSIIPAYASGMGLALLAELTEEDVDALYPEVRLEARTPKTIATTALLKQELEQTRRRGYAISNEFGTEGIVSLGTAIRDATGAAVAALSIAGPVFNMGADRCVLLGQLLLQAADLLSYRLGGTAEPESVRDVEELRSWWAHYCRAADVFAPAKTSSEQSVST